MPGIDVEFFPPDESFLLALLNDRVKEATEHLHARLAHGYGSDWNGRAAARPSPSEAYHNTARPVCRMAHQLPFRAYPLKKHHQLQFEEHDRINGGTTTTGKGLADELADKREVKCAFQMAIEVIVWY